MTYIQYKNVTGTFVTNPVWVQKASKVIKPFEPIPQLPADLVEKYKALHERVQEDEDFAAAFAHNVGSSFASEIDSEDETVSLDLCARCRP